jgi:hypothetical protein
MNKDLKMVHNFHQCLVYNSSRFHYLKHPRKGVIEKMTYPIELWIILENELAENSHVMRKISVWLGVNHNKQK